MGAWLIYLLILNALINEMSLLHANCKQKIQFISWMLKYYKGKSTWRLGCSHLKIGFAEVDAPVDGLVDPILCWMSIIYQKEWSF